MLGYHVGFAFLPATVTAMAGLSSDTPSPTEIILHAKSRVLELHFSDGARFNLPCELLRVYSPSAEVRGHGVGQEVLQTGKREVGITAIEPVGNYALKLVFSDGHDSGLYSWDWLHELGARADQMMADYLQRLAQAGASRDIDTTTSAHKHTGGCSH
jgi:DUF971 family protein